MFLGGKLCSQNCLSRLPPKTGSQQCQFYLGQQPPLVIGILPLDFCLTIILVIVAVLAAWGIHMCYNCAMGAHNAEHTETTMIGLFNLSWQGSLNVPSIIITLCVGTAILLIMEGCCGGCIGIVTFFCWKRSNPRARMMERLPPQQQRPDEISFYRPPLQYHAEYPPMLNPGKRGFSGVPPDHELRTMAKKLNELDDGRLFIA